MDLRIRLLGTVEVELNGTFRTPGAPQQRLLLAALAWEAGRAVSVDTLISRIWDEPPPSVQSTFGGLVSRLRTLLRQGLSGDPKLNGHSRTYQLTVAPQQVDRWQFSRMLSEAHSLAERGADQRALSLIDQATALWRGEPLAGLAGGWPGAVRGELNELRTFGELLRASVDLRNGRYFEALTVLRRCYADNPTHETIAEQLALALYGDGRPVDATGVIQEFSRRLVTSSGNAPGARLRRVQEGILNRRDVAELLPRRPATVTAPPAESVVRHDGYAGAHFSGQPDNLPPETPWVGRQDEVTGLLRLRERRPATGGRSAFPPISIDGMAGIGKTALAVHIARRLRDDFPDGQLMVDLRGFSPGARPLTTEAALRALLRATGLSPENAPSTTEQLTQLWRDVMRDRRAVVILDNARDVAQIHPLLLPRFGGVTLVTSRNRLGGPAGMVPLSLGRLPEDEAIALFERRVTPARRPAPEETARIVRLCDRLPLAVELVASRFASRPAWRARDLLARLTRPERLLAEIRGVDGKRIDQAFELSYRTLDERQRQVFRRVGAHLGGEFGVTAAAALSGLSVPETEDALEELLGSHLIQEPTPDRYRQHDLLRAYARELLRTEDPPGARDDALERLSRHYLVTADLADRRSYAYRARTPLPTQEDDLPETVWPRHADVRRWWDQESANLLGILEYARAHQPPECAALGTHVLAKFMESEGHLDTGLPALRSAAGYWRGTDDRRAEVTALLDLGSACGRQGDWQQAVAALERALALSRGLGDEGECTSDALQQLAITHLRLEDLNQATIYIRESLRRCLRRNDLLRYGKGMNTAAAIVSKAGRFGDSLTFLRQALRCFDHMGDIPEKCKTLHNIGVCFRDLRDYRQAELYHRRSLALTEELGDRAEYAFQVVSLAGILNLTGEYHEARRMLHEVLPPLRSLGDHLTLSTALNSYGAALQGLGQPDAAVDYHRAALEAARAIGLRSKEIQALRALGQAELRCGRRTAGLRHVRESLDVALDAGSKTEEEESRRALTDLGQEACGLSSGDAGQ